MSCVWNSMFDVILVSTFIFVVIKLELKRSANIIYIVESLFMFWCENTRCGWHQNYSRQNVGDEFSIVSWDLGFSWVTLAQQLPLWISHTLEWTFSAFVCIEAATSHFKVFVEYIWPRFFQTFVVLKTPR